jgi:hypothetical protein
MMKLLKGVPPRQYFFSLKKILRVVIRSLKLSQGLKNVQENQDNAKTFEDKFKVMFADDLVPDPLNLVNNWESDKEFARQFLNSVNPVMIQVVKDVGTQLTSEIVQFFAKDPTIDLRALADDKRLFVATYEDLMDLDKEPVS